MLDVYLFDESNELVAHLDMDMDEHALVMDAARRADATLIRRMDEYWATSEFAAGELPSLLSELRALRDYLNTEALAMIVDRFAALVEEAIRRRRPVTILPD